MILDHLKEGACSTPFYSTSNNTGKGMMAQILVCASKQRKTLQGSWLL